MLDGTMEGAVPWDPTGLGSNPGSATKRCLTSPNLSLFCKVGTETPKRDWEDLMR